MPESICIIVTHLHLSIHYSYFKTFCLLQQKTIHEHKMMLEENNPTDFIDVFLRQMEDENSDENSDENCIFTGIYIIVVNTII